MENRVFAAHRDVNSVAILIVSQVIVKQITMCKSRIILTIKHFFDSHTEQFIYFLNWSHTAQLFQFNSDKKKTHFSQIEFLLHKIEFVVLNKSILNTTGSIGRVYKNNIE